MNRRKFLGLAGKAAISSVLGASIYGGYEAEQLQITRIPVHLPGLPPAFEGLQIALLTDLHHSAVVSVAQIKRAVALANELAPDLVVLGGDFVTAGPKYFGPGVGPAYVGPCFEALRGLRAKHGVLAVTGNHDVSAGIVAVNSAISRAGFRNLTNDGLWLENRDQRLRIGGVGDWLTWNQNLRAAAGDATKNDPVIIVSHNPDYAEHLSDPRVRLILSGHTHGGQVVLPWIGAPLVPSAYGQKYRYGLIQTPKRQVYVTSGVGTLPVAVRINCPAEIALITLFPAGQPSAA